MYAVAISSAAMDSVDIRPARSIGSSITDRFPVAIQELRIGVGEASSATVQFLGLRARDVKVFVGGVRMEGVKAITLRTCPSALGDEGVIEFVLRKDGPVAWEETAEEVDLKVVIFDPETGTEVTTIRPRHVRFGCPSVHRKYGSIPLVNCAYTHDAIEMHAYPAYGDPQ